MRICATPSRGALDAIRRYQSASGDRAESSPIQLLHARSGSWAARRRPGRCSSGSSARATCRWRHPDRFRPPAGALLEEARRAFHLSVHRETFQDLHHQAATALHELPQIQVEELVREMARFMRWDAGGAVNLYGAIHAQMMNDPVYATQVLTLVDRFRHYEDLRQLETDLDRLRQFVDEDQRSEVRDIALGAAFTLIDAATQAFGRAGGEAVEDALVPPLAEWLGGATDGVAAD